MAANLKYQTIPSALKERNISWRIWKARKRYIIVDGQFWLSNIIAQSQSWVKWLIASSTKTNSCNGAIPRWRLLPKDWTRFNCDGVVDRNNNHDLIRGVKRDCNE
ncbi:hypothetical protein J1N35_037417 [Gossypium stocksii]|uniref:Uncharacterized protein n=1 Tax=Gossypium stocksii TaxID=47602 RepID=A0A9D3UK40_9ROSI|nr:hypothetical protein J1N35_037417 [Gossypium stocksii]